MAALPGKNRFLLVPFRSADINHKDAIERDYEIGKLCATSEKLHCFAYQRETFHSYFGRTLVVINLA